MVPFFISLGLIRMNRLHMDPDHRAFVLKEALACLRSPELH